MKHVLAFIVATGLAAFLLGPSDALAQSTRAPHVLEHGGKRFVAYVNEKSGTATWIIDTDSLDFNLGTPRSYLSEESVITASNAFLDAHEGVFGISRKKLKGPRVETDGTFWFISYIQEENDKPVLWSEVGITITYNGRIVAAGARAFPDLGNASLGANMSSAAPRRAPLPRPGVVVQERLVIVPEEQADRYTFREAWELVLKNREGDQVFHTTFLIDTQTRSVIAEQDNIMTSSSHGPLHMRLAREEELDLLGSASSEASAFLPAVPYALSPAPTLPKNLFAKALPKRMQRESVPSGSSSLYGKITLNYYESPDSIHHAFVRHKNQPFPYAKVTVQNDATQEMQMVYADSLGNYSVIGLADTTHTVTFEIANDKADADWLYMIKKDNNDNIQRILQRPFECGEKEQSFSVEINGKTEFDYNWGWGSSGDGGITAHALNSVYHVRAMYDYFKKTYEYDGIDKYKYKVNIYVTGDKNDGAIQSRSGKMYLGGPNAMSNEIIFHELTHSVIYTVHKNLISLSTDTLNQYGAIHEGFSDYFAADKTNDYTFAGPSKNINIDSLKIVKKLGTSTVRFLFNSCTMDHYDVSRIRNCKDASSVNHVRGLIIAGAIWKIRKDTERKVGAKASHLLFTALQMPPKAITFQQLRDNYTKADEKTNDGAYSSMIENRFAERRIGGPNIPGIVDINVNTKTKNPVISWKDNSLIEDGYWVERRYNDGAWSVVGTLVPDTETYTDTTYQCVANASNKNTYSYRIVPYKDFVTIGNNPGIGIVRSESVINTLSLSDCRAKQTPLLRIADASNVAEMMNRSRIQPQVNKTFTTGLEAPHPNPFNPATTIRYGLAEEGLVRLMVYDLLGRRVAVLADGLQEPGEHTVRFEASHLSTGLYFIVLDAAGRTFTKSVLLMK